MPSLNNPQFPSNNGNNNGNRQQADAWLNVRVMDKNGNAHSFKTNIPLYASRSLDASVMAKFADDPTASLDLELSVMLVGNGEITSIDI